MGGAAGHRGIPPQPRGLGHLQTQCCPVDISSATNMAEQSIEALSDGTPHRPVPRQASRAADGAEAGDASHFMVDVAETLPSNDAIQSFLASPECGAISTFVGITRDNFDGKVVTHLSYEGYRPMAIKELTSLCRDAKLKFGTVGKLVAVHILGDCPVGQASVVVGCSSPHRREAIRCTEFLIDELKGRVPIWKKEVCEGDGGSVWKENIEWHDGRRRRVMVRQE